MEETKIHKIMDKEIDPEHRSVVARLVKDLRQNCKINCDVFEVLVYYYGGGSGEIPQAIKKMMNDDELLTKRDKIIKRQQTRDRGRS